MSKSCLNYGNKPCPAYEVADAEDYKPYSEECEGYEPNMKGEMSMDRVSSAIDTVYEIIMQEWKNGGKHNINLAIALDQLAPFYRNAEAIYKEERRMYWIEMMDVLFDDGAEKLTAEELEKVLSWMEQNDRDETEGTEYKLRCALNDYGLTSKVCDEDEEEEG